jgi:hypothetical protein
MSDSYTVQLSCAHFDMVIVAAVKKSEQEVSREDHTMCLHLGEEEVQWL